MIMFREPLIVIVPKCPFQLFIFVRSLPYFLLINGFTTNYYLLTKIIYTLKPLPH
jgi:hypothetical protein